MKTRMLLVVPAIAFGLGLAACGDRDQVVAYKQGKYQGKTDSQPWSNAPYNGDKARWEGDLKARAQQQDESRRTGG